jgi:hypothetical protein
MWKKLPLRGVIYGSFGINLASVALILALRSFLPPVVPLFYGQPYGEFQLVPTLGLLTVPATSVLITLINSIIATRLHDHFYKKALIFSSLFVASLGLIAILKIIFLVGFF